MRKLFFFWFFATFTFACSKTKILQCNSHVGQTLELDDKLISEPLDLSKRLKHTRTLLLEETKPRIKDVQKIELNQNYIYIFDGLQRKVYFFTIAGKFRRIVNDVDAVYFDSACLFSYNFSSGLLTTMSLDGNYLKKTKVGFHGLEFAKTLKYFVFYTGGLPTDDNASEDYELCYTDLNGKLLYHAIPIGSSFRRTDYIVKNRFSRNGESLSFIPSFGNMQYSIKGESISVLKKFDFGKYTLTGKKFDQFAKVEDYNFFPYVMNIESLASGSQMEFYRFSLKGEEGYFLFDSKRKKIISYGTNSLSTDVSNYNNLIPVAVSTNRFVSLVSADEYNQNLVRSNPGQTSGKIKNPALIFFEPEL